MASKAAFRWNSGSGTQTLTGAGDACQFLGFGINPHKVGEKAIAVGDGVGYQYPHRSDQIASLTLPHIAVTDMAKVADFLEWVNAFGPFAVDTADRFDNSYEECQIAPGTEATSPAVDRDTLDLSISVTVLNIAASPSPLLCIYT